MDLHSKRPKLIGQRNDNDIDASSANAMAMRTESVDADSLTVSHSWVGTTTRKMPLQRNIIPTNHSSMECMSSSLISEILGFLQYRDIMRSRICCRKLRDAAKLTLVPSSFNFVVHNEKKYKEMDILSRALPNLQRLSIYSMAKAGKKEDSKYRDGNDPDEEESTRTVSFTAYNIQMVSNFRQLRELEIRSNRLNGRYPFLFDFPLLERLEIRSKYLKWDLPMLRGMPSLKVLNVKLGRNCQPVAGNIESLNVLKDTIESVTLCGNEIKGDIMDLADFPHLKSLDLSKCPKVTGDLRDIKDDHFLALKSINLARGIIGSHAYHFHSISDVPSTMEAIYRLSQRETTFVQNIDYYHMHLSDESPDRYESKYGSSGYPDPPHRFSFVRVGPRMGWRWKTQYRRDIAVNSCEVNWLDPEPSRDSSDYDDYIRRLEGIKEEIFCYEGFHQPPTEEEYKRLCEEYYDI